MSPANVHDDELWAAIAEPSRRLLLDVMLTSGESTPSALAEVLPFTRQAVAKHLAVLERAELVTSQRSGREVHYTVRPKQLRDATEAMARVAANWDQRLSSIKAIAETTHTQRSNSQQNDQ